MSVDFYQFYLNTKILFQPGISKDFSNELSQMGVESFLIVSDPYFAQNGVVDSIREGMETAGISVTGVFDKVPPNSELTVVKACAELASKSGAGGMVAVGGGSAMDTAKAANILFSLGGDLVADYSGSQTISQDLKPLIAIPTTAGTGSEVTSVAVIYDEESQTKLHFNDVHIRPHLALLDPELTLSLPPKGTAMTGMDALTHAIESLTSVQKNPMSDALAEKAIRMINSHLLKAVEKGSDLEARSAMMIAANVAGIAFEHAMVGVVHAMSHAAGGVAHVPHGLANSILLPFGMEYNLETSSSYYAELAAIFGIDTRKMSADEAAHRAIEHVRQMQASMKKSCALPDRLRDAGVQEDQLEHIAQVAVEDGASFYNPREVTYEEILTTIKEAY